MKNQNYISTLRRLLAELFAWKYVAVHIFVMLVTYLFVILGVDWNYFLFTMKFVPRPVLFLADGLGFLIPILILVNLFLLGKWKKKILYKNTIMALSLTTVLAFAVSTFYKIFTGRISPPDEGPFTTDISGAFHFGLMHESVIGGWPSSHATIMFALAACLTVLFPKFWLMHCLAFAMAFFIGIGVTFGFHWLSEFIAGALIGVTIGTVVGEMYKEKKINHATSSLM